MAEGEGISEGSISSLTTVSLGSSQNGNALSSEDLAWVDSCLTDVPESSGSNLNPLSDDLMEVINYYPEMFVSSSTRTGISAKEDDVRVPSPESKEHQQGTDNNLFTPSHREAEMVNSSSVSEEVSEVLALLNFEDDSSENSLQDDFLPKHEYSRTENDARNPLDNNNGRDGMERLENGSASDEEAESLFPKVPEVDVLGTSGQDTSMPDDNADDPFDNSGTLGDQIELSSKDIFKVWDLEIPAAENEDDEFELQLKKALDMTSSKQPLSRAVDDPVLLENGFIDDLITGISDLSLTKTST